MTDLIVREWNYAMMNAMGHAHTRSRGAVMVQDGEIILVLVDLLEERLAHCCVHRSLEDHHEHGATRS